MSGPERAHLLTPDGVTPLAVIWSPAEAAALTRDLARLTGRPTAALPDHPRKDHR